MISLPSCYQDLECNYRLTLPLLLAGWVHNVKNYASSWNRDTLLCMWIWTCESNEIRFAHGEPVTKLITYWICSISYLFAEHDVWAACRPVHIQIHTLVAPSPEVWLVHGTCCLLLGRTRCHLKSLRKWLHLIRTGKSSLFSIAIRPHVHAQWP